ncbi:MAG TPA: hypothetical protein VK034_18110 [Enhygromyxa sp.]|nr:hypothetical protein [Enhygromyxa sp.]
MFSLTFLAACGDSSTTDDGSAATDSDTGDGDGDVGDGDGDGEAGDGDGDAGDGDGDGDAGDGDGEPGDGDGDVDHNPMLFVSVPRIYAHIAVLADSVVIVQGGETVSTDLLRVSKSDASVETLLSYPSIMNSFVANEEWMYWSGASDVFRAALEPGAMWSVIFNQGGVGSVDSLTFADDQLFLRKNALHRVGLAGENPTTFGISPFRLGSNGDRLYGTISGELVEIDTTTAAVTPVLDAVQSFAVSESALIVVVDDALQRLPLDGGRLLALASLEEIGGYAPHDIVSDGEHVYWTTAEHGPSTVRRVSTDGGGEVEVLFTHEGADEATRIALDSTHAYWLTDYFSDQPGVWRLTK